jgi:hypothetical protein
MSLLQFLNNGYFAGEVGIGVESPLTNLDILGTSDTYVTIRNTGGGNKAGILMYGGSAGISHIWHDDTDANPPGIRFGTSANVATLPTTQMYIEGSSGNVGIGTEAPKQKLHVSGGTTAGDVTKMVIGATGGNAESYLYLAELFSGNNVNYGFSFVADGNSSNNLLFKRHSNSTSGTTVMEIRRDSDQIRFNGYSGTNQTGTPTYILGTTSGGDIVKVLGADIPGVPAGSGTVNYLAKWTPDGDTLGIGLVYDNGTNVGIGTTNPASKFVVADGMSGNNSQTALEFIPQHSNNRNIIFSYDRSSGAYKELNFDATNFKFNPGGSTKMVILSNGNVGINTTNPLAKLEVDNPGQGEFQGANSSAAGNSHLMLKDEGSTSRTLMSGPSVTFQTPASADGTNIWATSRLLGSPAAAGSARGTFSIQVRDNYDPFNDGTSWNWRTCLTAINTGNVGIGTNSPSSQFTVHKNALTPAVIELSNAVVSGDNGVVVAQIKANTVSEELTRIETRNSSGSHDNGNLLFYNRNGSTNTLSESMRIAGDGNVGIGVADPQAKLEVKGVSATPGDGNEIISVTNTLGGSKLLLGVVENSYGWIQSAEGSTYRNLLLSPLGGNVGIATSTPTNYRLEVNGTVKGDSFGTDENTTARIFAPSGAAYNGSGNQTGYLIMELPDNAGAGINNMMSGIIRVFDYAFGESFDVRFSGYWYSGYNWTNCTAYVINQAGVERNFPVRFGKSTGASGSEDRPYIAIGDTTSIWTYCKFSVIEYTSGHSNMNLYKWNSGWAASLSSTLPGSALITVSNTQTNNWKRTGYDLYYSNGGNVGIGTPSPGRLLELSKSVNGGQGATLRLTNAVGGSGAGTAVEFVGPGTQPIHAKIITEDAGAFDSNIIFQTKATGTGGALADRLTIDNVGAIQFNDYGAGILVTDASGNITAEGGAWDGPFLPLSAGSGERVTGDLYIDNNLYMRPSSTYGSGYKVMNVTGTGNAPYPTILSFSNYGRSNVMVINDENVGIGNTGPNYKLSVSGGIEAGGVVTYSKAAGSLDTTGYAIAGLGTVFNGASAFFTFTASGGNGQYQRVVYSCAGVGTNWVVYKVIDEGTNALDIEASATSAATIVFTFKTRSGTQAYSPRVVIQATGHSIISTYA